MKKEHINIYPHMRHILGAGRKIHSGLVKMTTRFSKRPLSSPVIPQAYTVCNTDTIDSDFELNCLEGSYPQDIHGSLFIDQCLGSPGAFMVGDSNIVRLDLNQKSVKIKNRLMWTPAAMARVALEKTRHRFDFMGLMYMSPGLGIYSYTEGMYLLPDGRIAVTSDVDRPWIIDREELKARTPLGRREEWLPMFSGSSGEVMGNLFAGYNNSHVIYSDHESGEVFLANFQYRQSDGEHPVYLGRWTGKDSGDIERWLVNDENGSQIEIKQSIHELIFTRDYILLADTAFVAGNEMMMPWKNAPLPDPKTVLYIIKRKDLKPGNSSVTARKVEVDEPCIHLVAEYENPRDAITVYMLHTPATNTAEILQKQDRDLDGNLFPENTLGYGTLPVLDLSSLGKHIIDASKNEVLSSRYISETPYTWGPYLYTYMGRQIEPYDGRDLFVMFKGFHKSMLPKRIHDAYKDVDNRRIPLSHMVEGEGMGHNNSLCRISTKEFAITDSYIFPEKTLLYTVSCIDSKPPEGSGYVMAGVVCDEKAGNESSGHEYWIFKADDLSSGPVCKLGHRDLNNSTLFHSVYIPESKAHQWENKVENYHVDLQKDYPSEELEKWDIPVKELFESTIWPYFDRDSLQNNSLLDKKMKALSAARIREHAGKEHIIGEERIGDGVDFAERMTLEAERLWSTSGWAVEYDKQGLLVESKPVAGPLEEAGVLVTRSSGELEISAQKAFDFLVSPEGYAVIDPASKTEDHSLPPLEVYNWRKNSRLEAAIARADLPFLDPTEFVVLNAIDSDERLFVSKSIIHDKRPGGSQYSNEEQIEGNPTRALNTFAVKIEPLSEKRSRVLCINYADMAGKSTAVVNNLINTRYFLQALHRRMEKAMVNL